MRHQRRRDLIAVRREPRRYWGYLRVWCRICRGPPAVASLLDGRDAIEIADITEPSVIATRGDACLLDQLRAAETANPDVVFGGEPSGAWIWPAQTRCPDGPFAACTLAALVGAEGSLAAMVDDLPTYPIRRDSVRTDAKGAIIEQVAEIAADEYDDVSALDGIRVETDAGWFLVRASGTESLVWITPEARDESDADNLFETARELIDRAGGTV